MSKSRSSGTIAPALFASPNSASRSSRASRASRDVSLRSAVTRVSADASTAARLGVGWRPAQLARAVRSS
jgi:hypothetical protein